MGNHFEELPVADSGREEFARNEFPINEPPGRYAAANAHHWGCFSFAEYRYRDDALTVCIHELGDILFQRNGVPTIQQLREQHLSSEELQKVKASEARQQLQGEL